MWNAKPSGSYAIDSNAAIDNILEIWGYISTQGWTLEACAGMIGNFQAESGLNPWRWQNDVYNTTMGYGLAQITPAEGYLENADKGFYFAPNLSTTSVTAGANPYDGLCQLKFISTNTLYKWNNGIWRSYWPSDPALHQYVIELKIRWSTDEDKGHLEIYEFAQITDLYDATLAFFRRL